MGGKVILAGGGSRQSSYYVDRAFAAAVDVSRPVVCVLAAMTGHTDADNLAFLQSGFAPHGLRHLVMWAGTGAPPLPLQYAGGVMLMGSDVLALAEWFRRADAAAHLCAAQQAGVPVYGGDAGAILLGQDIRTAPEAETLSHERTRGAGLVRGYSVYANFQPDEAVQHFVKYLQTPLLAIPESAGICLVDGLIRVYGTAPVDVLFPGNSVSVYPGASYRLP